MSSVNLGWLFYKGYYKTLNNDDYIFMLLPKSERENRKVEQDALNKKITDKVQNIINQSVTIEEDKMLGNTHFKATTTYPGLILGSGNAHELPSVEGQAILGFHFDYTSGLPVIQGSSIKGVLRSAFAHPEYIQELLDDEMLDVKILESEIFDNGDIFFDAVVVSNGKILGDDFLTPHDENGLKNPIPLRFIKVLPNIIFRFDFELISGLISKSKKYELFKSILEDLGIGAKTNVGYGKFNNFVKEQTKEEQKVHAKERETDRLNDAKKGDTLEALEQFKRDFSSNTEVDSLIAKFKADDKQRDIKRAFENLDKNNKRFVESFIKKYENNPNAKEFLEQLKGNSESKKSVESSTIEDLETASTSKVFKKILDELKEQWNETNQKLVKENIKRICKDLNKKKSNKFLREIKLEKYFDKAFVDEISNSLES